MNRRAFVRTLIAGIAGAGLAAKNLLAAPKQPLQLPAEAGSDWVGTEVSITEHFIAVWHKGRVKVCEARVRIKYVYKGINNARRVQLQQLLRR